MHLSAAAVVASCTESAVLAQTFASTTTFEFLGNTLPTGLAASDYTVNGAPDAKDHGFIPQNAYVSGGYLNLLVDGGQQNDDVISCGEVSTTFTVSSASVETYAILTDVEGVCNGMFLYESDNQETDIEWLSSSDSQSNIDAGLGRALFYTNQALVAGTDATSDAGPPPTDATTAVHNYRIDWNSTATTFYVDDEQQYQFTTNVPTTQAAPWIWNNWSNGDKGWSAGPPPSDAVFQIQKIVMRYNPGS